jgi:large subunit ribosomal protein L22
MATTTKKENNGYKAITRYLIVSPYKIRPVADLIRRKPYTDALSLLENMPHKGARLIRKTVISAASNALNLDTQLAEDMLYIKDIRVDEGPRMKRVWFRARGRADMLLKRLCHITVIVDQAANAATKVSSKTSAKAAARAGGESKGKKATAQLRGASKKVEK